MPVLYYVRHGETDFNVEARLQGRRDTALNPNGREQAARCGSLLSDLFACDRLTAGGVDYVASPLTRARQTMELLRATLELDPSSYATDERLMEISYGEGEGMKLPEME